MGSYINAAELADTLAFTPVQINAGTSIAIVRSDRCIEQRVVRTDDLRFATLVSTYQRPGRRDRGRRQLGHTGRYGKSQRDRLRCPNSTADYELGGRARRDDRIVRSIGQSFVATSQYLRAISLAYSDANPAEANAPIVMTIYEGTGTGGAIVATRTQTLPATLPDASAPRSSSTSTSRRGADCGGYLLGCRDDHQQQGRGLSMVPMLMAAAPCSIPARWQRAVPGAI
jgi:hypothetical protein